jgi:hypothetical protein
MATGTAGSGSIPNASAASTSAHPAERERYIEGQLRRTRRQVRGVELASRLMLLVAAAIAFFLVTAVVDHWLVPGGLGVYGRLAFLAVFLVGAGMFAAREIAPLFIYRISPVYAAHTIERAKPTLKNSLVNFLLLRSNRAAVPEVVLGAVEEQAASGLSHTPIEHVVDRTRLVQIGYVLLAMVAAFSLYYLASPKSPLQTLSRVVLPWADLQPPSRVKIDEIEPGTTTKFRGEPVTIAASVEGLDDDEPVMLYFTTADQQAVDQPVRMYSKEGYRFSAVLPPDASPAGNPGLQQDIEYRIEAGDAVSRTYRLSVIQAPNIVVERLDYAYPEYTRLAGETIERTGDVKAVEGTEVTIRALANQPIKSAWLELGGGAQNTQRMIVDSQHATGTITLALNEQRNGPRYSQYVVRFVTPDGHENPEPIRYRIEVTPDPAPEVQLLRPDKVEMHVPLDVPVQFELNASDPLYGLADVKLVANVGEKAAFRRNWSIGRGEQWATRFTQKHQEALQRVKLDDGRVLKPGDVIEYWAEAVDNKTPNANVTKSNVRKLIIVEPQKRQNPNEQPQENNQDQQGGDNRQQGDPQNQNNKQPNERNDKNEAGNNDQQRGNNQQQPGDNQQQPGDNQQQPNDNQSQKGDSNQKRDNQKGDGNQRNPNDAKGDQRQKNDQGKGDRNQQPMNNAGDSGEKGDQNQKGDSGKAGDDNQTGENKGSQQKNDAQKGGKGTRGANDRQNATGDSQSEKNDQRGSKGGEPSGGARDNTGEQNAPQEDSQQPVDKNDEGGAFDRILKHAQEKDGKTPETQEGANKQPNDDTKTKGGRADDQQKNAADKTDTEQSQGKSDNSAAEKKGTQNKGAQKRDSDAAKDDSAKADPPPDDQANGKSGEAQSHQDKQGSPGSEKSGGSTPPPQEKARPKNDQQPGSAREAAEQKEQSQGQGKKDSNTQGEESGDRRGDGNAGGGQNKNQAGKGAKGASDPSDEGAKAASEQGKGDTGTSAGDEQKAPGETGKSGTEKGDGSKTRQGATGGKKGDESKQAEPKAADAKRNDEKNGQKKQQPSGGAKGDKSNEEPDTDKSKERSDESGFKEGKAGGERGKTKGDSRDASAEGKADGTGGDGTEGGESGEIPDLPRVDPTDDEANLEYSRRATDMALDHLRNQLKDGRPDQELLDRLGWSKEDLQKLLSRWEKMEREAKRPGPKSAKAKENLREALRSLGWKRPDQAKRAASKADDAARGLRDANRSAPPPEYSEGFRAFQRSTSRAE